MTNTTDPNVRTCPRRNAPCARSCGNQVCKSQAEADMGLNMPPMILPRETAKAFAASVQQYFSESGIIIGRMAEFELPRPTITLGSITITPDGVTYNGETVKDAGAVHAALLDVLNGKPLPLAAPAPAANPSMAGADLHNAIMNLRCDASPYDHAPNERLAYKIGHRDARHAAAELAIGIDAAPVAQSTAGAELEALRQENDKLREALGDSALAATMLHKLSVENGGINAVYSGGAAQILAEALGQQFIESGAENYLEVGFNTNTGVRLLVTLQRCDGKTPANFRAEAEEKLAAALAELQLMRTAGAAKAELEELRSRIKQLEEMLENRVTYKPDDSQQWAKVDGAIAFHLIDRHADNWSDAGRMMDAWRKANQDAAPAAQAPSSLDLAKLHALVDAARVCTSVTSMREIVECIGALGEKGGDGESH